MLRDCELIHTHLTEPLTVVDVAGAMGVSLRSLQEGFRHQLDITHALPRGARLDAVRDVLAAATPGITVTDTALAHALVHLGRFSADYRSRFGEAPSRTLSG